MQNTPVSSPENSSSQSSSLENIESNIPKDASVEIYNLSTLAENYYNEGRYSESLKENEALLQFLTTMPQTQVFEKDLCKTFYRIGMTLLKQAQYTRCFEYLTKAFDAVQLLLNDKKDEYLQLYTNILRGLAEFYMNQDQYTEALERVNQSLAITATMKEKANQEFALNYNIQGRIFSLQGKYEEAIKTIEKALEILRMTGQSLELARAHYNLAVVYNYLSQSDKVEENSKQSLEIYCQCSGPRHPEAACVYDMLGTVNLNKGYNEKALKNYRRSLKIRETFLDKIHPDLASSYENIGIIFYKNGNYQQALEFYNKSLEMRKSFFTENHLDIASSYNNIGITYYEQANYTLALENFEKSLNIRLKFYGQEDHTEVASSYNNLGNVYESMGEFSKAIDCLNNSLKIRIKCLGENHIEVSAAYNNLAAIYHHLGQHKNAFENYIKSLRIFEAATGGKKSGAGLRYFNLGLLAAENLDYDLALNYFLKANKTSNSEKRGIHLYSNNQIHRLEQAKLEFNANINNKI